MPFSPEQLAIRRQRAREWNKNNKARRQETQKKWRQANRQHLREKARKGYALDPERYVEIQKQYRLRYPWYNSWQMAKQRCSNPRNTGYKYYGAKGRKFLLTKEDCARLWLRDKAAAMQTPSIDRIDGEGHYTAENCQFLELSMNRSKGQKEKWIRYYKLKAEKEKHYQLVPPSSP